MANFTLKKGDITQSTAKVLVIPVALQCTTGTDLAKRFKTKHPKNAESYGLAIADGQIEVGTLWYYSPNKSRKGFVNMPVKDHWRSKADLDIIEVGLMRLAKWMSEDSIAFSQEDLDVDVDWEDTKKLIMEAFDSVETTVEIWEK